jgi:hypothetical protein
MRNLVALVALSLLISGCDKAKDVVASVVPISMPKHSDATGKMVINPQFDAAYGFNDGLAAVRIGDDQTGKWGYIDKQGKMVINPQFNYASRFNDGPAAVGIGDYQTGKWGYISR